MGFDVVTVVDGRTVFVVAFVTALSTMALSSGIIVRSGLWGGLGPPSPSLFIAVLVEKCGFLCRVYTGMAPMIRTELRDYFWTA